MIIIDDTVDVAGARREAVDEVAAEATVENVIATPAGNTHL